MGSGRESVPGILLTHSVPIQTPIVKINFNNNSVWAIVDTGADISIMSEEFFNQLPQNYSKELGPPRLTELKGVTGHSLATLGTSNLQFNIEQTNVTVCFEVVKGITRHILLGSDFLAQTKATLDYENRTMKIGDQIIFLKRKSDLGKDCYLVQIAERVQIPAESEMIVPVNIPLLQEGGNYCVTQLENAPVLSEHPGVVIPNCLISVINGCKTQLVVINLTDHPFTISPGNTVALAERIEEHEIAYTDNCSDASPTIRDTKCPIDDIDLSKCKLDHIEPDKKEQLMDLLNRYKHVFANKDTQLGRTNVVKLKIDTGDSPPVRQRPYRMPLTLRPELEKQLDEMLEAKIIRPSSSAYSSPIILVPKNNNEYRLVVDFRKLNENLVKNAYPIPNIEDIISHLGNCQYYSKLDLKAGFWQVAIEEGDKHKTGFVCEKGLFEFEVMPFGLANSPSVWQAVMNEVLKDIIGKFTMVYVDDIIIYTKGTFTEHMDHICAVLDRLSKAGLRLKPSKCEFLKSSVLYLGHVITPNGIYPDPEKVKVIKEMPPPVTVRQVRAFLGMTGFYRKYMDNYSLIARPLTQLTRKHARFQWGEEEQNAFEVLKQMLTEAPVLAYPDVKLPYKLYTDASLYTIGAILTQDFPEGERVIQYLSHQLTKGQSKWCVLERECYAIVYAIGKLRHYLFGADFTVYTDHLPLRSLFTAEMKNARVQRWAILLSEYGCSFQYTKGSQNIRADMLSRLNTKANADMTDPDNDKTNTSVDIDIIDTDGDPVTEPFNTTDETDDDPDGSIEGQLLVDKLLAIPAEAGIKAMQRQDEAIMAIIEALEKNKEDPKFSKEYILENSVLYHIATPVRLDPDPRLQIVLPAQLIPIVLEAYHNYLGHMGTDKTYCHIRNKYFWVSMYRDVVNHVKACQPCNSKKLRKRRIAIQDVPVPEAPFQVLGIDTVGPYVESHKGNQYMITLVCWFSSWLECYPTKDKTAETVARVLLDDFIPRHGVMSTLVSDRGTEFCNAVIDLVSAELNIARIKTSPFHPQSNGKVEISHKTLNNILAKSLDGKDQRSWDDYVPAALLAYRVSVSDTTKMSPFFIVYGRDPQLPMDTLLGPKHRYLGDEYVPITLSRLHRAFTAVKDNLREARAKNQRYFNQRAEKCDFRVGDPVYYLDKASKPRQSSKLTSPWRPYYRIVEQVTPVNYKIRHQPSGKTKVVHAENLQPAHPEAVWDKERTDYKEIGHKYRAITTSGLNEPTRVQPIRQARLEVPDSGGMARNNEDEDLIHQVPSNINVGSQNSQDSATDQPSGGESSWPELLHRYNLRPRPTRPQQDQSSVIGRKRMSVEPVPHNPGELKRPHLDPLHVNSHVPMEVNMLSTYKLHTGLHLFIGTIIGLTYMLIVVTLLK